MELPSYKALNLVGSQLFFFLTLHQLLALLFLEVISQDLISFLPHFLPSLLFSDFLRPFPRFQFPVYNSLYTLVSGTSSTLVVSIPLIEEVTSKYIQIELSPLPRFCHLNSSFEGSLTCTVLVLRIELNHTTLQIHINYLILIILHITSCYALYPQNIKPCDHLWPGALDIQPSTLFALPCRLASLGNLIFHMS